MRPLRSRLIRSVVAALIVFALSANVAFAGGGSRTDHVPYDPGLPSASDLPYWLLAE